MKVGTEGLGMVELLKLVLRRTKLLSAKNKYVFCILNIPS